MISWITCEKSITKVGIFSIIILIELPSCKMNSTTQKLSRSVLRPYILKLRKKNTILFTPNYNLPQKFI